MSKVKPTVKSLDGSGPIRVEQATLPPTVMN